MNDELLQQLVDLYAGEELSEEMVETLEQAAAANPGLSQDMVSLKRTVRLLKSGEHPQFTEESYQRILMKLYANGVEPSERTNDAAHLQYSLPMSG